MRVNSKECAEAVARHPFLSEVIVTAFPSGDGMVFEDHVEIEQVGPDDVMYPRSMTWKPDDGTPSPIERPGERRRVVACLSDVTRVVRALCLQEYDCAVPWERMISERTVGRFKISIHDRLPANVFIRSGYDPSAEREEILWHHELSLAVATVWMRAVGEGSFVRSATIQFAARPEHGFQYHQRA